MAGANYLQTNFQGGEWSKTYQGRIDKPDYRAALNVCLNGIPTEMGAWTRRPGFAIGAATRGGAAARIVKFDFQQNSPYSVEMTDGYMRFYAGNSLAMTNDAQSVTAISTATPAVVTCAGSHGWADGATVMFNTLGTIDPLLENRQFTITNVSGQPTKFTIADALTGANVAGSALQTFTTGNVTRVLEVASPYIGGDWQSVRAIPAEIGTTQAMIFLHGSYQPRVLTVTSLPSATKFAQFSLDVVTFIDGPYLDPVKHNAYVTPGNTTGIFTLSLSFPAYSSTQAYTIGDFVTSSSVNYKSLVDQNVGNTPASSPSQWKQVSGAEAVGSNGFVSSDIGRYVRLLSEPPLWAPSTAYAVGDSVTYKGAYWTALKALSTTIPPGSDTVSWAVLTDAVTWTWGKIVSVQNQISNSIAGAAQIGGLTANGGLAAAIDGNTGKNHFSCASAAQAIVAHNVGDNVTNDNYIGWNFGSSNKQTIGSATIFPSSDQGLVYRQTDSVDSVAVGMTTTITLHASNTAPVLISDGTVLGSFVNVASSTGILKQPTITSPVTIQSSDTTTQWQYVWFEIQSNAVLNDPSPNGATISVVTNCAQVEFFSAATSGSNGVSIELLGPNLINTAQIRTWRLGLHTGANWPSCGTYHEGRLFLSGSVPNRFDASVANDIFNFKPTEVDGTVADDDAIDYTLNAPNANSVLWMHPDQQGVIVGTEKGEWLIQASAVNNPLTPTNVQAHSVTQIGSSIVSTAEPVRTDHTTVFIQRYQRKLMEYFPDVFSGKFSAPNIALPASHLTSRDLVELAYQQSVSPVIWGRCADGSLLGCSYKRETLMSSQGPSFAGWHRHTHGGNRTFSSIAIGPSADGALDTLAAVTLGANNVYQVEFLTKQFEETDALADAQFLDSSIAPTVTQNIVMGGQSSMRCSGLWHLNGETVSVFAGGIDCGDWPVSNGALYVPYGKDPGGVFTADFVSSYSGTMPVVVGFTYTSDGQLVRPASQPESGSRLGPAIGKKKSTKQITALLVSTRGISFGTSFAKLNAAQLRSEGETRIAATQTFTGTFRDALSDDYSYDSMMCWRVSRPYPATIAAIGGFIETQDA